MLLRHAGAAYTQPSRKAKRHARLATNKGFRHAGQKREVMYVFVSNVK